MAATSEIKLAHFLHEKGYRLWEQPRLTWDEIKMMFKGQEMANKQAKEDANNAGKR